MGDAVTGPSEVEVEAAARVVATHQGRPEDEWVDYAEEVRLELTAAAKVRADRTVQLLEAHTDQPVLVGRHLTWHCTADDCDWTGSHDAGPGTPAWREHLVDVLTRGDQ